jgi:hypothetical protein
MLSTALRLSVPIAAAVSLAALGFQVVRTYSRGGRHLYAPPQGSVGSGIIYAFGKGMLPWEKESAAGHLATYFAGVLYHLAIFAALVILLWAELASAMSSTSLFVIQIVLAAGLCCGLGLLIKRAALGYMRAISCVDDVIANLLADLMIAAALTATILNTFVPALQLVSVVLFLYIPLGKIRHCIFFFYTRILFGVYFGRRGVISHRTGDL